MDDIKFPLSQVNHDLKFVLIKLINIIPIKPIVAFASEQLYDFEGGGGGGGGGLPPLKLFFAISQIVIPTPSVPLTFPKIYLGTFWRDKLYHHDVTLPCDVIFLGTPMDHLNTWTRDSDIFQVKVYARRAMVYNSYLLFLMQINV